MLFGPSPSAFRAKVCWELPRIVTPCPPSELEDVLRAEASEVIESLKEKCPWLFCNSRALKEESPPRNAVLGYPDSESAGIIQGIFDRRKEYPWIFLSSELARTVVGHLLAPQLVAKQDDTLPQIMQRAVEQFAISAYSILISSGKLQEYERDHMMSEATRAMQYLVQEGLVDVNRHLVFALEAFGVTKKRSRPEQTWVSACIELIIRSAVVDSSKEAQSQWRQMMIYRIRDGSEIYGNIDIRSWEKVLGAIGGTRDDINVEAFQTQLRVQLCMQSQFKARQEGLFQAATIISSLRMGEQYTAEQLLEMFNDRRAFDDQTRQKLLATALENAPRWLIQDVLRCIDEDDVDISDNQDPEMRLVLNLLCQFREDIRCCRHAMFKMKSDWISGFRWDGPIGVLQNELLTPDLVCDHIESDENYQELLKLAVNKLTRTDRKFEAARMLARPAAMTTKVFETNRNDKQLAYLVSLYKEIDPPEDKFGPIEADALVLPCGNDAGTSGDTTPGVVHVQNLEQCQWLSQELLEQETPQTVGLQWFWRCFNPDIDVWTRASFLALTWNRPGPNSKSSMFAVVDFLQIEKCSHEAEVNAKKIIAKIIEVPFLLKVVFNVDTYALQILQRAVVPRADLYEAEVVYPTIAPMIDLAVVIAFCKRKPPSAQASSKLSGLVFEYLRLELCSGEQLSNFERRPLRKSQVHYALVKAWCPQLILRTLCVFGILDMEQAMSLTMQMSCEQKDLRYRHQVFATVEGSLSQPDSSAQGSYAENLWMGLGSDASKWRADLPRPDPGFNPARLLREFKLSDPTLPQARSAVECLFDRSVASHELETLYQEHGEQRTVLQ